ncbi:MAG: glycosyltransferase [Vicinamibacterales bacterium]
MSGRPTVLLLTTTFDVSGAERVVAQTATGLAARGYRVIVACLVPRSGALAALLQGTGVETVSLDMRSKIDPGPVWRLRRLLRRERVDVVYTFLFHAHLVGRVASRLARVPLVLSSQQAMDWETTAQVRLNRWTARWCDYAIGVSARVEDYLADVVRIPRVKLVTIYNCVDLDAFPFIEAAPPAPGSPVVIGSAARLAPEKDHDTLLAAIARLRDEGLAVRLLLAGDGSERTRLEALTARLGLTDAVEFLGHVSSMRAFHESLAIYVQSSHVEGLPVAVLEAMATGRPIVATRVAGNEEALVDGETGMLVAHGSVAAMTDALRSLVVDEGRRRAMGLAGRRRVESLFSAEHMVETTDALIRRGLDAKRR